MTYSYGGDFWTVFFYTSYTRASSAIEGHAGGPLYYFNYLATNETLLWVVLLPFAAAAVSTLQLNALRLIFWLLFGWQRCLQFSWLPKPKSTTIFCLRTQRSPCHSKFDLQNRLKDTPYIKQQTT
jgi:hypothetical protein